MSQILWTELPPNSELDQTQAHTHVHPVAVLRRHALVIGVDLLLHDLPVSDLLRLRGAAGHPLDLGGIHCPGRPTGGGKVKSKNTYLLLSDKTNFKDSCKCSKNNSAHLRNVHIKFF